jgi:D-alanine-D-alanine ligase
LRDVSAKIFLALDGNSFGRIDFRMNDKEEIFFLEMNPNCGVFYKSIEYYGSADLILHHDPIGHEGFLKLLFENAFNTW